MREGRLASWGPKESICLSWKLSPLLGFIVPCQRDGSWGWQDSHAISLHASFVHLSISSSLPFDMFPCFLSSTHSFSLFIHLSPPLI